MVGVGEEEPVMVEMGKLRLGVEGEGPAFKQAVREQERWRVVRLTGGA